MDWPLVALASAFVLTAVPGALHLARRRLARDELDFNLIDEAIHHLDTEAEPWTVHVEARVPGRIDEPRLRAAVLAAAARHPMARARQERWRPWHTAYRWKIEEAAVDAVSVSSGDAAAERAAFQSRRVPLHAAPPFRVHLVHADGGDYVMLNFNHAAADGVGTLRFLRSIARAYAGAEDPVPAVARDLARTTAPARLRERWDRLSLLRGALRDALVAPPARLAPAGGDEAPGFAFVVRANDLAAPLAARKIAGGTVNDALLGILHRAIAAWNEAHGYGAERIGTMMPINVRPAATWLDGVSNITYFVSISTAAEERATTESAVAAIRRQTAQIKERGTAAALREILFASPALLLAVKRRLPGLLPLGGERFVDTAVLSNLGRVDEPIDFGEAGRASELWFSPPCRMPLGLGVGAATHGGKLFLTYRYRRALWSQESAERFADVVDHCLRNAL